MTPLTVRHYHEIAWNIEKIPLDVDVDKYELLQNEGHLLCFSMRDKGKLVGYALFLLHHHPHYKSTLFASNDIVFIEQAYRGGGYGAEFLTFCESDLKCLGCNVILLRVKKCLDWGPLAEHLGFEPVETIYLKWVSGD